MFNHQSSFPPEQVRFWALQIAVMIAIRVPKPELLYIHFCPVTNFEMTNNDCGAGTRSKAYTLMGVSYEGLTSKHRLYYKLLDSRQAAGASAGTISDAM